MMISSQLILTVVIAKENCTVCLAILSVIELTALRDTQRHNYSLFLCSLVDRLKCYHSLQKQGTKVISNACHDIYLSVF